MNIQNKSDATRRAYWTKQMESAYDFMNKMRDYPVAECRETLVSLRKVVKDAGLSVLFSETKIAGKYDRIFYLRDGLIENFIAVAKEMNNRGWICVRVRNIWTRFPKSGSSMQKDTAVPFLLPVVDIVLIWSKR
jgi:hypothetical protein